MTAFRFAALVAFAVASQFAGLAQAQDTKGFPNRPVHIVVGTAAGGGTDTNIRLIQPKLEERLGVPIVVENRPGGSNQIAVRAVTGASPDGYTLLAGTMGMLTINPAVFPNLPYDTMRDLVPISIVCTYPMFIVVNAATPVKTIHELVDYIKANPDKANVSGTGSVYQMANKLFELRTGVKTQFVVYRSSAQSLIGLMRGDSMMAVVEATSVAPFLKDGRVRALAVLSPQRVPNYPDVPTIAEAGIKEFEMELWTGLLAPAGTPQSIVQKLNEAIVAVVQTDDVRKAMANLQLVPVGSTVGEYSGRLKREIGLWADVAKTTNFKIQR
jgi:tripartite-type tricarboxylate transporter receptor subunit TctC